MIKKLILPLLLSLGMVSSLVMNPVTVHAEEEEGSGIVTNKTVAYDETDGSYTITLESYATGEVRTSEVTKDVPTDIILVLDLSSSMTQDIGSVSYTKYENKTNEGLYALRHNGGEGNLWYQIPDTSNYASVSVTREGAEISYASASSETNSKLYQDQNNLWAEMSDGTYVKVTVAVSRWGGTSTYIYTYTYNGSKVTRTSDGRDASPNFSDFYLASVDNSSAVYTYSYTDSKGTEQTIATSTGGDVAPAESFYSRSTGGSSGTTRIKALKDACNAFADAVAERAKADGDKAAVQHRIAVVGFNRNASLYIGSRTSTAYTSAFQDMSTDAGKNNVKASIDALGTAQGTNADGGMSLANTIFSNNPVSTGETRNRVVIFFTDGAPGIGGSDYYDATVAGNTITAANTSRNSYGATVYSVAVIAGADPESAGTESEGKTSGGVNADKINWYLQHVSNNKGTPQKPSYYLAAADADSLKDIFKQIADQTSEGGSESKLNSSAVVKDIMSPYFTLPEGATAKDISVNTYKCIESGSSTEFGFEETSSGTGGATAVIDEDGNVSVTGFDFSEKWCGFVKSDEGVKSVREGGYKLVISFKVQPKDGFLGGNNVPTNDDTSGVYESAEAKTPVEEFTVPKANVTIDDVDVTAAEQNVYLLGSVTLDQIKSGATVTVGADEEGQGGVTLNLSMAGDTAKPYGLEKWKSEYVDITVTIKDEQGNVIPESGLQNLTEDEKYSIEVKISPKKAAETDSVGPVVAEKSNSETKGNPVINVFKPQLTFKDGTAYYGETAWTTEQYGTNCKTAEKWLHQSGETSTEDTAVKMIGEKPTLTITYTPDSTKLYDDGTKFGKSDVPVKAVTKMGNADVTQYTTFAHTACPEGSGCGWTDPTDPSKAGDPAFLVHIKTCTLTVKKQGDDTLDNGSYVFRIYKDGGSTPYSEVSIQSNGSQTLYELPIGTYTIAEDTGWSWRYSANPTYSDGGKGVALSSANTSGTITCTNTREKVKWLDGYSAIVRNVFGVGNGGSAGGADTK